MAHIYYMRHGETIWNVENKICGATDVALTELGHQQAIRAAHLIAEQRLEIDEILYSPLMRARDTALHISDITKIPTREEIRLKEQNFGKYESTPRNGGVFASMKMEFAQDFEGGESMLRLAQRIYNLLDDLKKDTNKTYLLVAHNGIARMLASYFYNMTKEEFSAYKLKNCEIRKFDFDQEI